MKKMCGEKSTHLEKKITDIVHTLECIFFVEAGRLLNTNWRATGGLDICRQLRRRNELCVLDIRECKSQF